MMNNNIQKVNSNELQKVGSNELQKVDSNELVSAYKKLLIFSEKKLSRFHNSGLLSRLDPSDLANEVVTKVLNGDRPWNKEQTPDLFVHFAGCANSIINNIYHSHEFRRRADDMDSYSLHLSTVDSVEKKVEFESKVKFIINYLISIRPDLEPIATLMLEEGVTEPKEISSLLGINVSEVNSKKLAIRRMLDRPHFSLQYIASNRPDLKDAAFAIFKERITSKEGLSEYLSTSISEAISLRSKVYRLIHEIHRGLI